MNLNNFFSHFVPQESKFFPILRDISENILAGADMLLELVRTDDHVLRTDLYHRIKQLETKGDNLLVKLFDELNNTFITPFDREDINALGEELDDVVDGINSAAKRIVLYQPTKLPAQTAQMVVHLRECCVLLHKVMGHMGILKKDPRHAKEISAKLHIEENHVDDLYEQFLIELFSHEKNAIELIRLKEVIQEIERATDKADSVGKRIKIIAVKYA
jgi:predicted phosphate transport protein (TIGR00153 family)